MSLNHADEIAVFHAARKIESRAEREIFVNDSCRGDEVLRQRVQRLLADHDAQSDFLDQHDSGVDVTVLANPRGDNLAEALPVSPTLNHSDPICNDGANLSVLESLSQTIAVPMVVLRELKIDGNDPIVRPKSSEMPNVTADSRYQLLGEIARGGMGAILKGRDTDLGRDLAIKVLLDAYKERPEVVQRFIEEAQIAGQLQHPGIAPVYELGQFSDRRPFFSMKLVKGETLSKLLADRESPTADRGKLLGIFEQVCQTMAYAHSRGVIHRDLKPANIMVGSFGEVQVMDWGLAKVLPVGGVADEKRSRELHHASNIVQTLRNGVGSELPGTVGSVGSQTQMGSVMGTPPYMPPEQALGEIDLLDERADVFGLGAILCEILTGKPPYDGEDATAVYRQAARGELDGCKRRLNDCGADENLVALAKHCLELEPSNRPRDARVLAERVAGYLESVETKLRESEVERAAQAARADAEAAQSEAERQRAEAESRRAEAERQRAESEGQRLTHQQHSARKLRKMLVGLAVVASLAVGVSLVAGRFWQDANVAKLNAENNLIKAARAEKTANDERNRADREAEVAVQRLYYAQMHLAQQAWREHRGLSHVRDLLASWSPQSDTSDRRGWEWFFVNSLPFQNVRTLTESGSNPRQCTAAWHLASGRLAEGTVEGLIRIWDVDAERTTLILQGTAPWLPYWGSAWLNWSPDGAQLVAGFKDGTVHVWDSVSGKELKVLEAGQAPVVSVAFSSDGNRLAAWRFDGNVNIWDTGTGLLAADFAHPGEVGAAAWSPDDKFVAVGHGDGTVTLSGTQPGDEVVTLRGSSAPITSLAWSPDSTRLVAASSYDHTARIWDVASKQCLLRPLRHSHEITSVAWAPDGERLATGSIDETIKIWDATTGYESLALRGNLQTITSLAWGPGGRLASGANDGSLRVWNSIRDQESSVLPGDVRVTSVAWSSDGKRLASGGDDGKIKIWDAITRQPIRTIKGHVESQSLREFGVLTSLEWSPDCSQLASASVDGVVKVWDVANGREVFALPTDHGAVWSLTWSPNGNYVAAGSQDGTIRLIEGIQQIPKVTTYQTDRGVIRSLAWSPKGDLLAVGGQDGFVKLWDPIRGMEVPGFRGLGSECISWSPDGKLLALAGNRDRLVIVLDGTTGHELAVMPGHHDNISAMSWSPDGTRLASSGIDNSVRVWDPHSGEEALVLRGNDGFFHDVSWHPDGAMLAAACNDGQVWIWDATRGFERDTTARALPFIDRAIASGTGRGTDLLWYAKSYLRAGKFKEALAVVQDEPYGLSQLAREFAEQEQGSLAEQARKRSIALLTQQQVAEPDNPVAASALADLLLLDSDDQWVVLKPTELKSQGGATLTMQDDGSILVSGTNPDRDVYSLVAHPDLPQIHAIRLEALPSPSLPGNGPGRAEPVDQLGNGNFHLNELRVFYGDQPARLSNVVVAYDEAQEYRNLIDGKIDETRGWSNFPRNGEKNTAIVATRLQGNPNNDLKIEMHFSQATWLHHNLGRFRVSVSGDPAMFNRQQARFAATVISNPWSRLAAAYHVIGDKQMLDRVLNQHPVAAVSIGSLYAAARDWKQAIAVYNQVITDQTTDSEVFARRAEAYTATGQSELARADWLQVIQGASGLASDAIDRFTSSENWRDAAELGLLMMEQSPENSSLWIRVAPLAVLSRDDALYEKFCLRVAEFVAKTPAPENADRAIKACLLRPNGIDLSRLPVDSLATSLDEGAVPDWLLPWAWGTRALQAYRSGDPEAAIQSVTKSESHAPHELTHLMNLSLLAMAQQQLQHHEEASQALEAARQLIRRLELNDQLQRSPDLQIGQILFREAEATIHQVP